MAFNGENTKSPIVANLIMECQIPVNIISADIREIEDKIYGQMLLELPDDNVQAERVCGWLEDHSIAYTKEV